MPIERASERLQHGLPPDQAIGLVLFGGHGSSAMRAIARQLDDTPLILICGHNKKLAAQLRSMTATAPRLVVEFTADIAYYMRLSDFFIGKPGPGSISEALQQQLPVVVTCNAWTMPQERYNAQWIQENNVGLVLPDFRNVRSAVTELTTRIAEFHANIRRLDNRAVFEIPDVLEGILNATHPARPPIALHDLHGQTPH
jgi:UDP-N-acetylglucosamine:LPS N-acetylglucosamine transferase